MRRVWRRQSGAQAIALIAAGVGSGSHDRQNHGAKSAISTIHRAALLASACEYVLLIVTSPFIIVVASACIDLDTKPVSMQVELAVVQPGPTRCWGTVPTCPIPTPQHELAPA